MKVNCEGSFVRSKNRGDERKTRPRPKCVSRMSWAVATLRSPLKYTVLRGLQAKKDLFAAFDDRRRYRVLKTVTQGFGDEKSRVKSFISPFYPS